MENENTLQAKDLDQQGVALFRAGNVEAALEKYQQAMDIEPMLADSYRNMGRRNIRMQRIITKRHC